MKNTGGRFYEFLSGLNTDIELPDNIEFINPYSSREVKTVLKQFCDKYYAFEKKRVLILGINPGRFGSGITGIPFTDPIALAEECHILNSFDKRAELSSRFIYEVINGFGGVKAFYDNFLLSAVCPLGFLKEEKNYNYYDASALTNKVDGLIRKSLINHSGLNVSNEVVISLGKKNADYLKKFNIELKLFKKIIVLEHPRYIMQYKLKNKVKYINDYCNVLFELSGGR